LLGNRKSHGTSTCDDSEKRLGLPLGASQPPTGPQAALPDPDLAAVVEAWPTLPEGVRQTILTVVRAHRAEP